MKNRRKDVFQLVLGAIMLGIFLAVYLLMPVGNGAIQSVVIVVASLPVTLYTIYCGTKKALVVVIAGLILSIFLLQPLLFFAYGAPALVIGLIGGWVIRKGKIIRALLVVSLLHLLQNGLEILLSQWMAGIPIISMFADTVNRGVDLLAKYVTMDQPLIFARDFLYCCIPVVMIGGALGKGVITCYVISMISKNKSSPFRIKEEDVSAFLTKLNRKFLAGLFLGIYGGLAAVVIVFLTKMVAYHLLFPACTVVMLCCSVVYLFYYYTREIVEREMSETEKFIRAGILVVLAPVACVAVAAKELSGRKEDEQKGSGSEEQIP